MTFYWPVPLFRLCFTIWLGCTIIILQTLYRKKKKSVVKPSCNNVSISDRGMGPKIVLSQGLNCLKGH